MPGLIRQKPWSSHNIKFPLKNKKIFLHGDSVRSVITNDTHTYWESSGMTLHERTLDQSLKLGQENAFEVVRFTQHAISVSVLRVLSMTLRDAHEFYSCVGCI